MASTKHGTETEPHTSIKITIMASGATPIKVVTNGRPLAGDNLTAVMYEACVNAWGACLGLDHDKIASITIEIFTPLHGPVSMPSRNEGLSNSL
jgi:hypothetical protein